MSAHRTTKLELRCTPDEKARWQAEADAVGTSVSALVRDCMRDASNTRSTAELALEAEVLQPLCRWLALDDADGQVEEEMLAEWKAYAAERGVAFAELLRTAVVGANARHLA